MLSVVTVTASPDEAYFYRDCLEWMAGECRVTSSEPGNVLAVAATCNADVVILDLTVGEDGQSLIGRIRSDAALWHLGIVVVTGWTGRADVEGAYLAGCDSLCWKPIDSNTLLLEVRRVAVVAQGRRASRDKTNGAQ